jgi:hypothetical protein
MTDQPTDDRQPTPTKTDETAETPPTSRFPELEELQNDVARRIRDNQKFLDRFMDDEFIDDDPETTDEDGDDDAPEDFEEL